MGLTLTPSTYAALERLAASTFDRALVLSRYAGGPMCTSYRPCLALVVSDVGELVQFVLGVQTTARRLEVDGRSGENRLVSRELLALTRVLESGDDYTYQYTWTDGQTVFYWPNVRVED